MERNIRACLLGLGRTGKEIAGVLLEQKDIDLVAVFCSEGSEKEGQDLGEVLDTRDTGLIVRGADQLEDVLKKNKIDVAIDFTWPEATLRNCAVLAKHQVRIVVGTTGFNELQQRKLKVLAEKYKTGITYAPNITLGVNVLMLLSNLAASILDGYDCSIVEAHFKDKVDAPSGTAKKIVTELRKGIAYHSNDSEHIDIPVHAIRAGGIIGSHKVVLAGEYDKIEITHESFSRRAFATGAIRAVRLIHQRVGYFEMQDVLDLNQVMQSYIKRTAQMAHAPGKSLHVKNADIEAL